MTRVWAKRGSRPTAVHPSSGRAKGMFFSRLDTEVMNHFLDQIAHAAAPYTPIVLILDRAGYPTSKSLKISPNITLKYLPPYSPELNPVENLWHYLCSQHWPNRYYRDTDALEEGA